jgi:hypothetical protein
LITARELRRVDMSKNRQRGCTPKDWEPVFAKAGVLVEELAATKSSRGRATKIGQFFGPLLGREVPIQVKGRTGKAVLRVDEGRAKERRYVFEISWDGVATYDTPSGDASSEKVHIESGKVDEKARKDAQHKSATKREVKGKKKGRSKPKQGKQPASHPHLKKQMGGPAGGNQEAW